MIKCTSQSGPDIIKRWDGNPVITYESLHFPCLNIMNAGAAKYNDQIILLIRVETMQGYSVFVAGRSPDGIHFILDKEPVMEPAVSGIFAKFENRGVEDPRITFLDGTYYIVYTANSSYGQRLVLAKTDDFKKIERVAFISGPNNKNGALFPKKIAGRYARLDRPFDGGNMWISYSDDLLYWGNSSVILTPRGGGFWDSDRVGCEVPPIEVDEGWLVLFYGVRETSGGPIFRLGAAILDKDNPAKLLGRSDIPILSPREDYERIGDGGNMVFSCGAIVEKETNELYLYYGASNMVLCLGTAKIDDIIKNSMRGRGR